MCCARSDGIALLKARDDVAQLCQERTSKNVFKDAIPFVNQARRLNRFRIHERNLLESSCVLRVRTFIKAEQHYHNEDDGHGDQPLIDSWRRFLNRRARRYRLRTYASIRRAVFRLVHFGYWFVDIASLIGRYLWVVNFRSSAVPVNSIVTIGLFSGSLKPKQIEEHKCGRGSENAD